MEDITAMIKVKICGLKSKSSVQQAVLSGADYIGFVFYNKSPRYINPIDVNHLSNLIPKKIKKVLLLLRCIPTIIKKLNWMKKSKHI